jgi:Tfp pilus assembly protein PilN
VMGNLDEALSEIEPKIADIRRKKAELTEIKRNIDYDNSFYKVLTELYRITPENVMFVNISFEKKKQVEVYGRTATADDVYNYVNILKDSPHFKEASLNNIQWRQMYKVPVREFHITCVLSSNEERRSRRR